MAETSTLTNTILDAGGSPVSGVVVRATLMPGPGFTAAGEEISGAASTTTNGSGVWSLVLVRNTTMTPAGTYYRIQELIPEASGGARVWAAQVGATDQTLAQSLVSPPKPATPGPVTLTAGDERYRLA